MWIRKYMRNMPILLLAHNQKTLLLKWINLICIFSLSFLFFYLFTQHSVYWDIFTSRDIQRAFGWLKGRIHWPGPEMVRGNNLPGPFFYFLLFPLKLFGENTYSHGILWLIIWLSLTYTIAFSFLSKIIRHKESLLIFLGLFYAAGGNLFHSLKFIAWNPAFAIMFHVLAIMTLYFWRETNKNSYLYLTGLIIALGIQIHLLTLLHAITVFLFCLTDIRDKKERKPLKPFILFLFLISFPVLLYNILAYFNMFETSTLKQENMNWFIRLTFHKNWFNRISVFNPVYTMPPLVFCFFLTLWEKWKSNGKIFTKSTGNLFIITMIPLIIGGLSSGRYRYTYFIPVCFLLLLSKVLDDLMPKQKNKKLNFLIAHSMLCVIFFILFDNTLKNVSFIKIISSVNSHFIFLILLIFFLVLFLIINTEKIFLKSPGKFSLLFICLFLVAGGSIMNLSQTSFITNSFSRTQPSHQKLHPLMKKIALETGWSPKEAMKHIYAIGIHLETSILTHYSMSLETIKEETLKNDNKYVLKEKPTGYMIIQHLKQFIGYSKKDWQKYLVNSSLLSDFLRQEIATGRLFIEIPKLYDSYWLIPYKTTSESAFIEGFHNIGQPYYWEEPEWLKNCDFTKQFKIKEGFYYCMVLPGYLQRAGVHIKFSEKQPNKSISSQILNISFFGPLRTRQKINLT